MFKWFSQEARFHAQEARLRAQDKRIAQCEADILAIMQQCNTQVKINAAQIRNNDLVGVTTTRLGDEVQQLWGVVGAARFNRT